MSADTDRLDARLSNVEGTVSQMNERIGAIEERVNTIDGKLDSVDGRITDVNNSLDDKIDREVNQLRTDFRRWLLALFAGLSLVFTVVSIVVQLAV